MNRHLRSLLPLCSLLALFATDRAVLAQSPERWFQVEVSIFTNESLADREAEFWVPETTPLRYPGNTRRLQELMDLLMIDDLRPGFDDGANTLEAPSTPITTLQERIATTGPFPPKPPGDFRFFDFDRDAFVLLPNSESDFQQTNRAIERAAGHRLLYHSVWRQPVVGTERATPLYIQGGLSYGAQHELQGSLTIRFNANADRVVVDADLWLSEFSIVGANDADWQLPPVPARLRRDYDDVDLGNSLNYQIRRTYRLQQSRDMRSDEFHYIDHPAMGLVIEVNPYEVPPAPLPILETTPVC